MNFVDTHFHMDECDDVLKYISESKEMGVNKLVASCCNVADLNFYLNLIEKYDNLYLCLGIHPEYADNYHESDLDVMEKTIINNPKIVGIGEIGLDYHYSKDNIYKQKELFDFQLRLANKLDLPVVIHSRDATMDTYNMLSKYNLKGIIHCFSGSYEMALKYINLGFFLGIGGVSTFKNSKLPGVINKIGVNNMVLETDSPYLAPTPYRGEINSSKYIPIIAENVSNITGLTIEKVAEITTLNASSLFDLN